LLVVVDAETNTLAWTSTLQLSDHFALTAYDASYLELAIRRQLALATLDRQLADAARASGIEVLP
jgi:predicted nucleic acid-binding protein